MYAFDVGGGQNWYFDNPNSSFTFMYASDIVTTSNGDLILGGIMKGTMDGGSFPDLVSPTGPDFEGFVVFLKEGNGAPYFSRTQSGSVPVSINEPAIEMEKAILEYSIAIAPNPTNGLFTLTLPETSSTAIIDIFDIQGKKVQSINQGEKIEIQIDLSNETAGLYLLRINLGNEVITKKVLLVK